MSEQEIILALAKEIADLRERLEQKTSSYNLWYKEAQKLEKQIAEYKENYGLDEVE